MRVRPNPVLRDLRCGARMLPANVPEIERQLWCGGEFERVPCARGRPDGKAMFDIAELVWPRAEHQPSEQPRNSVLAFGLAGDDRRA